MPYPPPRRLWVQIISKVTLKALMEHKDLSIRGLEAKSGVNKSTIGHLLTGVRSTCLDRNAKAIAKALDVPTDALFALQLSPVTHNTRQRTAA